MNRENLNRLLNSIVRDTLGDTFTSDIRKHTGGIYSDLYIQGNIKICEFDKPSEIIDKVRDTLYNNSPYIVSLQKQIDELSKRVKELTICKLALDAQVEKIKNELRSDEIVTGSTTIILNPIPNNSVISTEVTTSHLTDTPED